MDKAYYDSLPVKMRARAKLYIDQSRELFSSEFSTSDGLPSADVIIKLAAAMMQLEAAEVVSASVDNVADKIEEK